MDCSSLPTPSQSVDIVAPAVSTGENHDIERAEAEIDVETIPAILHENEYRDIEMVEIEPEIEVEAVLTSSRVLPMAAAVAIRSAQTPPDITDSIYTIRTAVAATVTNASPQQRSNTREAETNALGAALSLFDDQLHQNRVSADRVRRNPPRGVQRFPGHRGSRHAARISKIGLAHWR